MAEAIWYRGRARVSAVQTVNKQFRAWLADTAALEPRDWQVNEVEGWIWECLTHRDDLAQLREEVHRMAIAGQLRDLASIGELILQGFDWTIDLVDDVLAFLQSRVQVASTELQQALDELRQARNTFRLTWPTNARLWEQASKDIEAGRVYTVGEVRHELQRRRACSDPP